MRDEHQKYLDVKSGSFFQTSVEYDKSFTRYLVIGNGAAISFLINYATKNDSIGYFRCSLILFSISLCLAAVQIVLRSLQFNAAAHSFMDAEYVIENEAKIQKTGSRYLRLIWANGILAALIFAFALFKTILAIPS